MYLENYFYLMLSFMSLVLFIVVYKYFLLVLISLEFIVMNIGVLFFFMFSSSMLEVMFIYYVVFSVCESVMGLTILVIIVRFYGGDYYMNLSMIKF